MASTEQPREEGDEMMQTLAEEEIPSCDEGGLESRKDDSNGKGNENHSEEKATEVTGDQAEVVDTSTAKLKRQSTMAATAKEGLEYLTRTPGAEEPDDGEDAPSTIPPETSSKKPKLQRDSTIDVTTREGLEFLSRAPGAAVQDDGEDAPPADSPETNSKKPQLQRDSTIDVTAREGLEFLSRAAPAAVQDDGEDAPPAASPPETNSQKPKLHRDSTIDATAREGKDYLERVGGVEEDEPAREKDSGVAKSTPERGSRPKLQRGSTIATTLREAEEFLNRTGGNRGEGKKNDEGKDAVSPPRLRRDLTMKETAKVGGEFVGEKHLTGSRKQTQLLRESEKTETKRLTRASLKRAGTMDITAAEGKQFLKRKKK